MSQVLDAGCWVRILSRTRLAWYSQPSPSLSFVAIDNQAVPNVAWWWYDVKARYEVLFEAPLTLDGISRDHIRHVIESDHGNNPRGACNSPGESESQTPRDPTSLTSVSKTLAGTCSPYDF